MGRPLQEADLHTARLSQNLLGFSGVFLGYQSIDLCEIIATELLSLSIECKWGRVLHYSGVTSHQSEPLICQGFVQVPAGLGWKVDSHFLSVQCST